MKNNILKYFILFLSVLVILMVYLSIAGIETDKFNNQIKNRVSQINKNIDKSNLFHEIDNINDIKNVSLDNIYILVYVCILFQN